MPVSRTHSLLCLLVSSIPVVADQLLGLLSYRFFHLKQTPAINLSVARAVHESTCYPISNIEARWLKLARSYEFAERIADSQAKD